MDEACDIVVVGAGAAGLTAGIFAGEAAARSGARLRIVLLDGAARLGAKILAAGGGRCNVTHRRVRPEDYNGPPRLVRNVLAAFDERATVRWFASLGVELVTEETGKLFPAGGTSRTVLDALLGRCASLGVTIATGRRVHAVERVGQTGEPATAGAGESVGPAEPAGAGPFLIHHERGQMRARRVILATGGRSWPRTGSDGEGWPIAQSLGHGVVEPRPALVPLTLKDNFIQGRLAGLAHDVELSVFADGRLVDRRSGSLLWTHTGVSGPVVLDASRHWIVARAAGSAVQMRCCLLPGDDFTSVERWLTSQASEAPQRMVATVLHERLPQRLVQEVLALAGVEPRGRVGQLRRDLRRALVHTLTELELPLIGDRGWNHAEVTAGGVPLEEVDYRTMESRKAPGLHLAGEMLDVDGRVGGFNLQWAWSTGHIAGTAAAKALGGER